MYTKEQINYINNLTDDQKALKALYDLQHYSYKKNLLQLDKEITNRTILMICINYLRWDYHGWKRVCQTPLIYEYIQSLRDINKLYNLDIWMLKQIVKYADISKVFVLICDVDLSDLCYSDYTKTVLLNYIIKEEDINKAIHKCIKQYCWSKDFNLQVFHKYFDIKVYKQHSSCLYYFLRCGENAFNAEERFEILKAFKHTLTYKNNHLYWYRLDLLPIDEQNYLKSAIMINQLGGTQ